MEQNSKSPAAPWFLGPKAENADTWTKLLTYIFNDYVHWRRNHFPEDPLVLTRGSIRRDEAWLDDLSGALDHLVGNLKAHFPFYSPRYLAHMLSEQTLPSVLGYFAGMLYNPNNVTAEAAPVTVRLEIECGAMVAEMLGYNPRRAWAHITSGGTVANLEALWIARAAQLLPFVLRDLCKKLRINFEILTANGSSAPLTDVDDRALIGLIPNDAIAMPAKLVHFWITELQRDGDAILREINLAIHNSIYNAASAGIYRALQTLKMEPVIYASAAAHYSIRKAANVLGYGERAVRVVPVDTHFRMDVAALRKDILNRSADTYTAAVVGIVGTTEEGAVDPIHELCFLRTELQQEQNTSFWLHADAAWGGYIATLFRPKSEERTANINDLCALYINMIGASERVAIPYVGAKRKKETCVFNVAWSDPDVYKAFLALEDADSITVDPHKLGYMPYPCGVIAFRNAQVTDLVAQRAPYISDTNDHITAAAAPVTQIGPYILEGSKPGAAAAAAWLAHKTIPLNADGHGRIIRASLLSARKLYEYLWHHARLFQVFETAAGNPQSLHGFTFEPLFVPDTNIICFIAVPRGFDHGQLVHTDLPLEWLNRINHKLYGGLSIDDVRQKTPYAQTFYVSRTTLDPSQYSADSIAPLLERLGIASEEYERLGLFVLRSTVMNPLYQIAEAGEVDYLFRFVTELHRIARQMIHEAYDERSRNPHGVPPK